MRNALRDPDIRWLLIAFYVPVILTATARGMLVPVLPLFAADFDVSYGLIGLVLAGEALGTLIGDVPAGLVLRRLGPRRALLIGFTGTLLATAALYWAPSILIVLLLRLLSGFMHALYAIGQHSYLSGRIALTSRGRAIASFGGMTRLGVLIGPVLGGAIASAFGLRMTFLGFAIIMAIAVYCVVLFMRDEAAAPEPVHLKHTERPHLRSLLREQARILTAAGLGQVLAQTIRAGRTVLVPLFAADILGLDVAAIGLAISIGSLVDTAMFIPAGYIMDRRGRKWAIVPSFTIQAVGILLLPLVTSFAGLAALTAFMGFGNGLGAGSMMTLGADLAPPEQRGEFLGVWRLIGDTGFMGAPILVGGIADIFVLPAAAIALAISGGMAALTFGLFMPETLQKRKRT